MSASEKLKCIFFLPIAFLVGVIVVALLQLFEVGGAAMALILGGGLLLVFLAEKFAGLFGNFAILRSVAKFSGASKETFKQIEDAEAEDIQRSLLVRIVQLVGFAIGIVVSLILSPGQIMNLIGRLPHL